MDTQQQKPRKKMPKRFYVYGFLVLVIILLPFWDGPRPGQIVLAGSASEMGQRFGRKSSISIRLLLNVYLKRLVCGNERAYGDGCKRAGEVLANLAPEYQQEIAAVAKAAGVDVNAVMLGNSFLDLGLYAGGCRSVVAVNGNRVLHGHNLDWDNMAGLANWTVTIIRREPDDGRLATVTVGFPGLVGSFDIINSRGVCLSFNQLGFGKGTCHEPVAITLRRVAERCATFAEARREILHAPPGMPFVITVSDAKTGEAAVFERDHTTVEERVLADGLLTADNAAWGPDAKSSGVDQRVRALGVASVPDLIRAFRDPDVMLGCNIYSVIFDYAANRFYLASGRVPAAEREYRELALFAESR